MSIKTRTMISLVDYYTACGRNSYDEALEYMEDIGAPLRTSIPALRHELKTDGWPLPEDVDDVTLLEAFQGAYRELDRKRIQDLIDDLEDKYEEADEASRNGWGRSPASILDELVRLRRRLAYEYE